MRKGGETPIRWFLGGRKDTSLESTKQELVSRKESQERELLEKRVSSFQGISALTMKKKEETALPVVAYTRS